MDQTTNSSNLLPRGVRRALEAMRADVGREWSLADLAAVAGQSGRTLQRQFRSFLGKTPGATLRDLRFEHARREFLIGLPDVKITDVALHAGFAHFGRFAVEYRRRYGETPSQTRRRQAIFVTAVASMPAFFPSGRDRPTIELAGIEAPPEHAEFARGMAEDLTTALARAGVYAASQPKGARYQLRGSLRGSGPQAHLTFRLLDGETGQHLWAHRTDGVLGIEAAAEEPLATRIAAALQPCLRLAEVDRARRKPDVNLGPHDLALRALPGVLSLDRDGNARALELLERAIERDPGHALANALAAWARVQRVVYHFTAIPLEERARSTALARKAMAGAGDATVLAVLGNALTLLNDLDAADVVIRKALAVDGGSAWAWSRSGWLGVYRGNPAAAIERFKIALELAPNDPLAFNSMVGIGCAHFHDGNYLESARWQERALVEHPSAIWVHRTMGPAYALGGAKAEAQKSLATLRQHHPDLTIWGVRLGLPPLQQSFCDRLFDALQTTGLPP